MRKIWRLLCLGLLLLPACTVGGPAADSGQVLRVFAAASLTDAFSALARSYEDRHEGVRVELSFAGSSTLAAQIQEGAPADVFASANELQMQRLQQAGLLHGPPQIFARNLPVFVVNRQTGVESLAALAMQQRRYVLAAPEVPIRSYSDQILQRFASAAPELQALARAIPAQTVSEEADVRQVMVKVALGEADAGIVYATDISAELAPQVTVLQIPPAQNLPAAYPIAALSDNPAAQTFIDFVLSAEGQALLALWGFLPPDA